MHVKQAWIPQAPDYVIPMLSLFPTSAVVSKRFSGTLLQEADAAQMMLLPPLEQPGWPYLSAVDLSCQCPLLLAPGNT